MGLTAQQAEIIEAKISDPSEIKLLLKAKLSAKVADRVIKVLVGPPASHLLCIYEDKKHKKIVVFHLEHGRTTIKIAIVPSGIMGDMDRYDAQEYLDYLEAGYYNDDLETLYGPDAKTAYAALVKGK